MNSFTKMKFVKIILVSKEDYCYFTVVRYKNDEFIQRNIEQEYGNLLFYRHRGNKIVDIRFFTFESKNRIWHNDCKLLVQN